MRDVGSTCTLDLLGWNKALTRRSGPGLGWPVGRWVGGVWARGLRGLEAAPGKRSLCASPGTYLTHEAKGSDDAPDADTAIINAEGGQPGGDDKKEYFI